jgi:hypothetical protein
MPAGLRIFDAAAALLVGQLSMKDILPPRALLQRQISSNAPFPIYEMGSKSDRFARARPQFRIERCFGPARHRTGICLQHREHCRTGTRHKRCANF